MRYSNAKEEEQAALGGIGKKNMLFELLWPQLSMKFRQIALPQSHSCANGHVPHVPSTNPLAMLTGRAYILGRLTISRE